MIITWSIESILILSRAMWRNSHRVQCLENSYILSAHAQVKCCRDFERWAMGWEEAAFCPFGLILYDYLPRKEYSRSTKPFQTIRHISLRRQKEINRSWLEMNEPSPVTHVRFPLSSLVISKPRYATPARQSTKSR